MKIISIDDRLKSIASLVSKCDVIADVGTDHGYLPIYLIQNNIANFAFATDVAASPLASAKENIAKYGLESKFKTILCDGLTKLPKNVDTVIIAGMGGNLMIDILENKKFEYKTYVLQPNLHHYALRKYLMEHNYTIVDEKITYANKKYYEIFKVVKGKQQLSELQLTFGPINLEKKEKLFIDKWEEVIGKLNKVLENFKGNETEYNRIKNEITTIENVINGTIAE